MRFCPFGKFPKPLWQRQLLKYTECFLHGDHVLNSCLASLLIHVPSRAKEPPRRPGWVSGRNRAKTYDKGSTARRCVEKPTLPRTAIFGKDIDETYHFFK